MKRKIIQITSHMAQTDFPIESLYALCDDGSLWENTFTWSDNRWNGWRSIPPLPDLPDEVAWAERLQN